jgi:hypothetical protein
MESIYLVFWVQHKLLAQPSSLAGHRRITGQYPLLGCLLTVICAITAPKKPSFQEEGQFLHLLLFNVLRARAQPILGAWA